MSEEFELPFTAFGLNGPNSMKTITIMVTKQDNIDIIKQKIFLKEGVSVKRQKIQVYASFMQPGSTLADNGVGPGFSSMRVWIKVPTESPEASTIAPDSPRRIFGTLTYSKYM